MYELDIFSAALTLTGLQVVGSIYSEEDMNSLTRPSRATAANLGDVPAGLKGVWSRWFDGAFLFACGTRFAAADKPSRGGFVYSRTGCGGTQSLK